jgi:membrane-associated phospholipid phosphatase
VTRVFVVALAAITLAQAGAVPTAPWLLAADLLVLILLALLERSDPASRVAGAAALWYPLLLIPVFYTQLGVIGLSVGDARDAIVQGWEATLFGGPLSVTWRERMPSPVLSSLLHLCYFAHYFVYMGVPLWLYLRAGREPCERALFGITLAFYVCFLVAAVFPVAGPWYAYAHPAGPAGAVAPARLVHALLDAGASYGTAFPSSHVAASWAAVLLAVRDARRLALGLAPVVLGLALGTVYGQFHYAVDACAGAAVALACWLATDPFRAWLASRRPRQAAA